MNTEQMNTELIKAAGSFMTYSHLEMIVNILLGLILGIALSLVYRHTHTGLSYSQSFNNTLVLLSVVVSIVMMVIGSSLARAFALVGSLSIIRFRTAIKDVKDMAYVFAALTVGIAAGTSNHFLAIVATGFIGLIAIGLYKLNFGALYKSDFIIRFSFDQNYDSRAYMEEIQRFGKRSTLLHIEPTDGNILRLTYNITLKENELPDHLATTLGKIKGVSEVILIASKNDINY
jgi:hypothetical protein